MLKTGRADRWLSRWSDRPVLDAVRAADPTMLMRGSNASSRRGRCQLTVPSNEGAETAHIGLPLVDGVSYARRVDRAM